LRRTGRFAFLQAHAVGISARRWQKEGLCRTTLRNWCTRALWELGASPEWLWLRYHGAARWSRSA